ncbi:MAG: SDR family NAD(P)-dependent oxidoreductase [Clostridia bacterium]|nr:SDR family NAD(P)-dependent oxidoreductase [Clostridia bacterium]
MRIAIVTGASSGLGTEYVNCLAGSFCKELCLDQIWVTARRQDRLLALKERFGDRIVPIPADLSEPSGIASLIQALDTSEPEVAVLVNCAGFGTIGPLSEQDPARQGSMTEVNVRALTELTTAVLPRMKKGAFVVNVCSIAAFAPNPNMTVYCSTKAYVLSFSKSLRFEEKKKGINVLAVCPGPMDTEFLPVAGIERGVSKTFDTLPRCDPKKVACRSLTLAGKGRGVYTPRLFFKFYRVLCKIFPHAWMMHLSKT